MIRVSFRMAMAAALLAGAVPAVGRTWTDRLGRSFDADYVRLDGSSVILRMAGGREFSMPLVELSDRDQAALRFSVQVQSAQSAQANLRDNFGRPWPREIRLGGPVNCKVISEDSKTGRYIYESPGYRFTCDARVTDDAMRNFSVMFESTLKYAKALPLGLGGQERNGRLDIVLFGNMMNYIRAGGPPNSAGCYTRGVVLVPMESLGLREGNTGFSLDVRRDNKVLIHELAHQLTPVAYMQPGARGWFSEGLAEYMAITPYNWGYFAPDIHGNAVKAYVTGQGENGSDGRALGMRLRAPKLRYFFLMPYGEFSGSNGNANYGLGLLLTHYFLHMEGGGRALRITRFLQGLRAGQQGETALAPLLGGGTYEKLEEEISAAWARKGVEIKFGG